MLTARVRQYEFATREVGLHLDSSEFDGQVFRMLELLTAGSRLLRSADRNDSSFVSFYALKDEAMEVLHRRLSQTGAMSLHFIPYLRRCVPCKKRADALHAADPSRSWEYHLNLLPRCPADAEDLERSSVSMTIRWQNQKFNLHAPRKEALRWNVAVEELDRQVWVPDNDYVEGLATSPGSLTGIVGELGPLLAQLRTSQVSTDSLVCRVFLSAASADYALAAGVRDFLIANGRDTFLASVSLATQGDADYLKAITSAIDSADHMVVVTSRAENTGSKWVQYEWGMFLNEKLAGRKPGNLLTVTSGTCVTGDLHIALRTLEVVPLTDDGLQRLLGYLKKKERG